MATSGYAPLPLRALEPAAFESPEHQPDPRIPPFLQLEQLIQRMQGIGDPGGTDAEAVRYPGVHRVFIKQ